MSLSGAAEVTIGLIFTYFVFSSVCSGLNEAIANVFNSRGTQLFKTINALIGDKDQAENFWKNELIAGLSKARSNAGTQSKAIAALSKREAGLSISSTADGSIESTVDRWSWKLRRALPSYISPTVAVTVMRAVAGEGANKSGGPTNASSPPSGFQAVLSSLKESVVRDEERLQAELEKWFNDAMDRLSGWYKRYVQIVLLVLAAVVTVAFNVNTIRIAQELWRQPALQAVISQEATRATTSQNQGQSAQPPQSLTTDFNEASALPVGWGSDNRPHGGTGWGLTILGWLLTIGALTFGAPFWFDLLSRGMNSLRLTGPPTKT